MAGVNKIEHRLLGKKVEPAINAREVELEIQFDPEDPNSLPQISLSSTDWILNEAEVINNYVAEFGIHAGIPYEQIVSDDDISLRILNAYLKPSGSETVFECDQITNIPVVLRDKNESVTAAAKLIFFNVLLANGGITKDQYVQVPYELNTIPDYKEAAFAALVAFSVAQKLVDIGKEIAKVLSEMLSVIGAISGAIKVVVIVAWIIISIVAIILFTLQIAQHLIQPIKFHAGMRVLDLLNAGCKELGLTFVSSIFDDERYKDAVLLPAKPTTFKDKNKLFSLGFTSPSTDSRGYYKKSFFDLLIEVKGWLNGKITITDSKKLVLERKDKNNSAAILTLPNLPLDEPKTNASEIIANYEIAFQLDGSDDNTSQDYFGTTTNALTTSTSGAEIIDLSDEGEGHNIVQFNVARGSRKEGLNDIQKRFDELFKSHAQEINAIIGLVNATSAVRDSIMKGINKLINRFKLIGIKVPFNTQPIPDVIQFDANVMQRRIGILMLSKDSTSVDKIMSLNIANNPYDTELKPDNSEIWNTENLYGEFHSIQSHAATIDGVPFGNQFNRHELGDFHLCLEDVVKVINNNLIFTHDGRVAKIESLRWRPFDGIVKQGKIRVHHVHDPFLETEVKTESGE